MSAGHSYPSALAVVCCVSTKCEQCSIQAFSLLLRVRAIVNLGGRCMSHRNSHPKMHGRFWDSWRDSKTACPLCQRQSYGDVLTGARPNSIWGRFTTFASDTCIPGNVSDYAVYRHTQRPRRDTMSRGDSSLRPRARTVSHDKAILPGARTEPRRFPVRLRCPHFRRGTAHSCPSHRSASDDLVTFFARSDCYRLEPQLLGGICTR